MLGQQFYHETMRKVVVAFGTIFNNINIVRKNNSGTVIQRMKVPLGNLRTIQPNIDYIGTSQANTIEIERSIDQAIKNISKKNKFPIN